MLQTDNVATMGKLSFQNVGRAKVYTMRKTFLSSLNKNKNNN